MTLGACRAPETAPLESGELVRSVSARDATPQELRAALELAGLQPLALAQPSEDATSDPDRAEFWHVCAWAWSPATRAARRRWEAAQARAGSAGRPGPIRGVVEVRDVGDPGANTRMMLTFDLIGLLGLGPTESARLLADAETRSALNGLEEAMWTARFEVDEARVRLAAARAALQHLDELQAEAFKGLVRIEILERNGRIAAGGLAAAHLAMKRLSEQRAQVELEEVRARKELALAAGLEPEASALAVPNEDTLADWPAVASDVLEPTAEELLERVPQLRARLLEYAIAEARLRDVAAQRWPSLALGPHLFWGDPDFLVGAIAASGLPWPGSLDGEIDAACIEREAARERVEDGLLAIQTGRNAARSRMSSAQRLLEDSARPAAMQSSRLWTAAQARFAVEPTALEDWSHALTEHARSLRALERARAELALAQLEFERSSGPAPEAPRYVESPLAGGVR